MKLDRLLGTLAVVVLFCIPAQAVTTTCQATLSVVGPNDGTVWLPGKLTKSESHFTLSFGLAKSAAQSPPIGTIDVDVSARMAMYQAPEQAAATAISFDDLAHAKFSEIASTPERLGGLVLLGDRLKGEARFLRNSTYLGEPVQVYAFKEGDSVVGQVLYSTTYGLPIRLDTYDTSRHVRRVIELTGIKR